MYLNHSCNIMPDSYCENISLTDSGSNACKTSINPVMKQEFLSHNIQTFNVQFTPYQDKDNFVLVSFISGCLRLKPVLAN